jgi:hypothetical protein
MRHGFQTGGFGFGVNLFSLFSCLKRPQSVKSAFQYSTMKREVELVVEFTVLCSPSKKMVGMIEKSEFTYHTASMVRYDLRTTASTALH